MSLPLVEIGRINSLEVLKSTEQGLYLGDSVEEILLPNKYIPEGLKIGDFIDVFIYTDSEDRLIATTLTPNIMRGEFAYLKVKDATSFGTFMDWGLEKDLLVPFKEQLERMDVGKSYLVYMYLDNVTDRLVGSTHLNKFVEHDHIELEEGEEVQILVGNDTDLGFQCIVNGKYKGLVYKNQIFKDIQPGDLTSAFVKQIRPDNKIDLVLERTGHESIEPNAEKLFEVLKKSDGFLPLHDKSEPEEIKRLLQMSKKNFKKALGTLYKKRLVTLDDKGVTLK
ncbi:MAG: S1-like domain-containing RNA-binding protein [Marinoscillum sp.]|uniref:CvfB family protein n=1 Tax=Marinoscillum sp. TaxID=2024838 RepID=UPI0033046D9C